MRLGKERDTRVERRATEDEWARDWLEEGRGGKGGGRREAGEG